MAEAEAHLSRGMRSYACSGRLRRSLARNLEADIPRQRQSHTEAEGEIPKQKQASTLLTGEPSASSFSQDCSLLSGSLALEALLIGVHCKKRDINV